MKRINSIVSLATVYVLITVFQIPSYATSAETVERIAVNQLLSDLSPQMHNTKRAITVFNYSHGQSETSTNQQKLQERIGSSIQRTWDALATLSSRITYTAGNGEIAAGIPGFYAALDPVVSAQYGGQSDWQLLTIKLSPSFRYLELGTSRDNNDALGLEIKLRSTTLEALSSAGCDEKSAALLFISPKNAACANIVIKTLKELKAQGILYPFESAVTHACPNPVFSALILIDPDAIKTSEVRAFSSNTIDENSSSESARLLAEVIQLTDKESRNRSLSIQRTSTVNSPLSPEAAMSWINDNLFGCGNRGEHVNLNLMAPIVVD